MAARHIVFALVISVSTMLSLPAGSETTPQDASARSSVAAFGRIVAVFKHPRCLNCHTVTDFPRQGDDRHRHTVNVHRGADGRGVAALHCQACHQRSNQTASGVPGADEDWHLAPMSMGWEGLSDAELCRHLLDPRRNGRRTGAQLIGHLGTNLVRWAWAPGSDRAGNARTTSPLDYDTFIADAHRWIEGGAVCPSP